MRILIVDDDPPLRKIMSLWLKAHADVHVASDGEEAFEMFSKLNEDKMPYDIIFMDIMMPGLNGIETLKKIRALETQSGIPPGRGAKVIMVSAMSGNKSIIGAFKEQCDDYLVKPVDKENLYNAIRKAGYNIG